MSAWHRSQRRNEGATEEGVGKEDWGDGGGLSAQKCRPSDTGKSLEIVVAVAIVVVVVAVNRLRP